MKFYYDGKSKEIFNHCFYNEDNEHLDYPFIDLSFEEWNKSLQCYPTDKLPFYNEESKIIEFKNNDFYTSSSLFKQHQLENQMQELKSYLTETDYIITKINEAMIEDEKLANSLKEKYAIELNTRKEYRKQINELEAKLKELN